jgi:hypothetical protein
MYTGPNITTDGLVFSIDAANPKSYVSGSTVCRSMVGTTTGSLFSGTAFSTDGVASFYFDGTDDYASFGRFTAIEGIPEVSMCAWVKTVNVTTNPVPWIITTWFPDIAYTVSQFAMQVGDGGDPSYISAQVNASTIPLMTWILVCGTFDGTRCRLYWNGELKSTSNAFAGVTPTSTNSLIMGRSSFGGITYSNVFIANTTIYTRALSAAEVSQIYNSQKSRFGL